MSTAGESVFIPAGELVLEGVLRRVAGASHAAVIAHPYPIFGGNMDSPVVLAIEDGLQRCGVTSLRFNFRGTGASTGQFDHARGELDDLRAAAAYLVSVVHGDALILAGYSFGAIVALRVAPSIPQTTALVAIAPPLSRMPFTDREPIVPELFVVGDRDRYCRVEDAVTAVDRWPALRQLQVLGDAEHELRGQLELVTSATAAFVAALPRRSRST